MYINIYTSKNSGCVQEPNKNFLVCTEHIAKLIL